MVSSSIPSFTVLEYDPLLHLLGLIFPLVDPQLSGSEHHGCHLGWLGSCSYPWPGLLHCHHVQVVLVVGPLWLTHPGLAHDWHHHLTGFYQKTKSLCLVVT